MLAVDEGRSGGHAHTRRHKPIVETLSLVTLSAIIDYLTGVLAGDVLEVGQEGEDILDGPVDHHALFDADHVAS